ncbi:MAG: SDR family NAD(P)-dependent oxidoreductase [Nocardioidaceae bacterium]
MELYGKVAVVTGAGSGLGWFIAEALRAAGATVIAVAIVPGEGITTADVANEGGRAGVLQAAEAAGGADVLVNNAGSWSAGGAQFPDAEPARWRAAIELDLLAPMALIQLLMPGLLRGRGAVVNVASSAGVEMTPYGSPEYGAAKAGLIRFTTSVGDWHERYGVRVNCVVPGWVGLERARDELAAMPVSERAATPALVRPEMIAEQVARLLCDDSLSGRVVTMLDGDHDPILLH